MDHATLRTTPLENFPPPEQWDHWEELDAKAWPRRVTKQYSLVPTICFNCEAACGLVAYVDKQDGSIRKVEGNPYHPGSRGRNCAKGPATINQVHDTERILYPLKRVGPRGSGRFERVTWDEVLQTLGARIRKAIVENRRTEVMYHVGRPGHDGYVERVLQAWGVDGHNSHTNVCSAAARLGYTLWSGYDRPSPDYENAKFTLLISSHLETGHYFNPHAQRIIDSKMKGGKLAVCDIRLSNTASMGDYWLAPRPGTEPLMLLGFAHVILRDNLVDWNFVRDWVEWRAYQKAKGRPEQFAAFQRDLVADYAFATPAHVAEVCGLEAALVERVGREIGQAGSAFASHVWRNTAAGNEGGWSTARNLQFVSVLVGAVATVGGTAGSGTNKFVPAPFSKPRPQDVWSELLYPHEWPLAHHELSYLLPHLVKSGRGRIDTYFTRVYNPVWTNPDGAMWIDMLADENAVGCHAVLSPTWNETARWADFVLPMGHATERHDLMSQETHAATWIGFRQPVHRVLAERQGKQVTWTYEVNPGQVWEEDEFWIALSWQVDPDGSLGIRQHFESPYRKGERITITEYYRWIFENSVPGLPAAAAKEGVAPLEYMQRHGCFLVQDQVYKTHEAELKGQFDVDAERGIVTQNGKLAGVFAGGKARVGFPTPSKKLELHSPTMVDWGWPEYAAPAYVKSHVDEQKLDRSKGEMVLVATFRLPTLIHTRSANSKWLTELSNTNPVWIHPSDAQRIGVEMGDLVRVSTRIGYYVNAVWVTEGVRPGVIACSHHMGRWAVQGDQVSGNHWQLHDVDLRKVSDTAWLMRRTKPVGKFGSSDKDSDKLWWSSGGVHQNMTFPVQPDPISGMHCWHQQVVVTKAEAGDRYGDVYCDTKKSMAVFEEWLAKARPAGEFGTGGLRRPLHLKRVCRPTDDAFKL
ncbi:MAG: molybdopterin-dependent oxidoreductase [Planctomycetes bacterium]|jgi:anaerobic selenocysteine-containing dehydrogenase|nr:molybdopterin-dependent oxidoreductase [Planctomycetota bacterium]